MPIFPASSSEARLLRRAAALGFLLVVLTACGKKGPPLPPTPRGPLPPGSVQARQHGSLVEVRFDVPALRGPQASQQAVRAELIRVTFPAGSQPSADPDAFRRRGVVVDVVEQEAFDKGSRVTLTDASWIGGIDPGRVARYAVRLRDRRGRPSSLVVARDLELLDPGAPPTGLRAEPTADGMRLTWDPPAGIEEPRFNLYRTDPLQATGETPVHPQPLEGAAYLDAGVENGRTYRYVLRRSLAPGRPFRESASSDAVIVLAADRFAPPPPDGLVAVPEAGTVRLFWNPGDARDLGGYRVYRRVGAGAWERVGADPVTQATFIDRAVSPGQELAYRVTAVDRVDPPNESAPSDEFALQLPGTSP